jgi:hypothetical protein
MKRRASSASGYPGPKFYCPTELYRRISCVEGSNRPLADRVTELEWIVSSDPALYPSPHRKADYTARVALVEGEIARLLERRGPVNARGMTFAGRVGRIIRGLPMGPRGGEGGPSAIA